MSSEVSIRELWAVERKLEETKIRITEELKRKYFETKKDDIYRMFDDGIVGPIDFKVKDSLTLRQVAKKLIIELSNRKFNLKNLFAYECETLKHIGDHRLSFLNDEKTDNKEGLVLMKWFENLWIERDSASGGCCPPGGLPTVVAPKMERMPQYSYVNVIVRRLPFVFCCVTKHERKDDIHLVFRSDLTGYDLREMLYRAGCFRLGIWNDTYTYVHGMTYDGCEIDDRKPIPGIIDGAVIMVDLVSRSVDRR